MIVLLRFGKDFIPYNSLTELSQSFIDSSDEVVEIEALPQGDGRLRRNEGGVFYYEPYPPVPGPDPAIESNEEKLERIDSTTSYNQIQTEYLIILAELNQV